jgi:hypothetical protein
LPLPVFSSALDRPIPMKNSFHGVLPNHHEGFAEIDPVDVMIPYFPSGSG